MRHFCFRYDKKTAAKVTIEDAIKDVPEFAAEKGSFKKLILINFIRKLGH